MPDIVNPEQSAVLSKFVSTLSPEDKEKFLRTLSEEERMQFSSSLEEFRQVFGREPEQKFPKEKPDNERDVRYSGVKLNRIEERYNEIMKMFPEHPSIDAIRAMNSNNEDERSDSIFRSTDELRQVGDAPSVSLKLVIN